MTGMPTHVWVFRARMIRVVDGDTLDLLVDVGMHGQRLERVRLLGVDCPEVRGPTRAAGLAATAYATGWLAEAWVDPGGMWPLVVVTEKDPDNFGRYLATVYRVVDGACLNDDLILSGNGSAYTG